MIPQPPARQPGTGFLYLPPFRIQGWSIAGEESVVQIPELDVCFDIGRCPRFALTSDFVALTHGHMDHSAGIAYYYSQRHFQGMSTGTVICPRPIEQAITNVMHAWVELEAQKTPFHVRGMDPDEEIEIKNNIILRTFATKHTVPSLGYVIVERRSKLRPDLIGLPQEELVRRKNRGEQITDTLHIPLVCCTGDTMWGDHFEREDVLNARILITECTFLEAEHRPRASVGRHLHLDDIAVLLQRTRAEAVVLTHLSRRTNMNAARTALNQALSEEQRQRVFILMDNRTNRQRYEEQFRAAEAKASSEQPSQP